MSDGVVSVILTQLTTILQQQIEQEVRLVSGVEREITKLETEFKSIKAVIIDAENRSLNEEVIKIWLENLKDVAYDAEDVLSEWITATQITQIEGLDNHKVSSSSFMLPCLGFNRVSMRRDIAVKIKKINERLVDISQQKDRYNLNVVPENRYFSGAKSASFVDETQVEGRALDASRIITMLLSEGNQERALNVFSIIGMGGIGKTTLAQMVYNTKSVIDHFDMRIWVCVSDPFDEIRIAKAITEDIEGHAPCVYELETAARKIRSLLIGKRFLLVLDDVWTEESLKWEQIFNSLAVCASGSVVIMTTRKETVAKSMGSRENVHLGQLSDDDSWCLFKTIAFEERSKQECKILESAGRKIADKCKGLPLSLKTIASLMRFKKTLNDWLTVLNSEFWELQQAQGLFPPLMLSYYDLPSPIKPCFSFCAFFPKDHVIEADNLVKLWMAQGYLSSAENMEMETLGWEFIEYLAMRSFFHDLKKEKDHKRIASFKMHDMIHDFALYLNKNDFSFVEIKNGSGQKLEPYPKKARHLILIKTEDTRFPNIHNVDNLVSLWVQAFYDSPRIILQPDRIESDLFLSLNRIKSLDLSRNRIGELPKEIGKLMKLRYLNLSHNPFVELPQTLPELYKLQTLKLNHCYHLRRLPLEIKKLINLRHLEINHTHSLKTLPKGIGLLLSIQTLSKFIIVQGTHKGESSICNIEDLKKLNNLRGCLKIEGLGCVSGAKEAEKAELKNKIYLSELHIDFSPYTEKGREDEVIQGLELHENLHSLQISSYGGTQFPFWFMKLKNLRKLYLQDCRNCSDLPPLGRLPALASLQLEGFKAIKSLGLSKSYAALSEENILFPKLKKLKIMKMDNWEEWDVTVVSKDGQRLHGSFKILPCLKYLKLSTCIKLKTLPSPLLHMTPLEKLRIQDCPFLKKKYNKETGEYWTQISHIPKIRIT